MTVCPESQEVKSNMIKETKTKTKRFMIEDILGRESVPERRMRVDSPVPGDSGVEVTTSEDGDSGKDTASHHSHGNASLRRAVIPDAILGTVGSVPKVHKCISDPTSRSTSLGHESISGSSSSRCSRCSGRCQSPTFGSSPLSSETTSGNEPKQHLCSFESQHGLPEDYCILTLAPSLIVDPSRSAHRADLKFYELSATRAVSNDLDLATSSENFRLHAFTRFKLDIAAAACRTERARCKRPLLSLLQKASMPSRKEKKASDALSAVDATRFGHSAHPPALAPSRRALASGRTLDGHRGAGRMRKAPPPSRLLL
ncbi:unnamed protein product [Darwinula stevensoni]|uniref:Uncharacterized protein n=1 Tax=Darwinula stevensoni TaxID=69355 RepID=A0A7R9AGG5_9CRUS|nr:unnamed protein product [Darwinula stevensoni]CAG0903853.1 unnamed protein product [Darwinula stevensoni]